MSRPLIVVLTQYGVFLLLMCVVRIWMYLYVPLQVSPETYHGFGSYLFWLLLHGLWRDNVLAALVLFLPLGCVTLYARRRSRGIISFMGIYYSIVVPVCLFIAIANVPYFAEFYKILDKGALAFLTGNQGSLVAGMLLSEPRYYWFAVAGLALWVIYIFFVHNGIKWGMCRPAEGNISKWTIAAGFLWAVGVLLTRPTNVNQARFSSDPQYDKMAICAPLYFGLSVISHSDAYGSSGHFVAFLTDDEVDSLRMVYDLGGQRRLEEDGGFERLVAGRSPVVNVRRPNIILIQMEGMSACLMESFGCTRGLTPFLDSLYQSSLSFSNCYSIGPRTNFGMCGIFSSWPTFLTHHAIQSYLDLPSKGISQHLHDFGYHNLFFLSHDVRFDGLDYYFPRLMIDEVFSQKDYPQDSIVGPWGVNDGFLFDFALPVLNREVNGPFFASIMTISNHPPYILPDSFDGDDVSLEFQAVRYADQQLERFYQEARRQPWFDSTLFVFVADHGNIQTPAECELPEQLNHIPLIIAGAGVEPFVCTTMTSQMDLMAIVLGLLGEEYECDNFSIDVLQHPRRFVVYSSQTCFGCKDEEGRLFVHNADTDTETCYRYEDGQCRRVDADSVFSEMRDYLRMIYQMADNMTLDIRR